MLCCCAKKPNTSSDKKKSNTASAQENLRAATTAGSQPEIRRSDVTADSQQPQLETQPPSSAAKTSQRPPSAPVDSSDIKVRIASDNLQQQATSAKSASDQVVKAVSADLKSSEPKAAVPKASLSNMPNIELKSLSAELDKLYKAVKEAEAKPSQEARGSVSKLANQLQALTSQVLKQVAGPAKMADSNLQAVVSRLEAVAVRLESLASKSGTSQQAAGDSDAVSPYVLAYDDIVSGPLAKFLSLSAEIGGHLKAQAGLVKEAFEAQRNFLVVASKSKQPDQSTLVELLKSSATKLQAVQDFRENNRKSDLFNHLSAISESIPALGWVTVSPAPGPYVKEMVDAGTFYTNRVLKDFKEKDPRHVEWSRSWIATLTELQSYIKQYHTTGLSWNPQGGDARAVSSSAAQSSAAAPPPSAGGAPPPPPPPGPPPPPAPESSSCSQEAGGPTRSALFAEINKGTDVTSGLKKVTDDMKTYKNPSLRQGPAPFKPVAAPKPASSPAGAKKQLAAPSRPPLTELQGKKWVVEYHKGNKNIVLDQVDLKQTIYVYKCEDCVIKVQGKVNSIVVDSSKKTGIVFDDLVSSLEFVNCQSMQAQVTGKVPTLSIDKTDGCLMYLSPNSLDVEIVSAKSSEMNILVPVGNGDYKEFALPEQYKTIYDGKSFVTTPSDIV